MIAGGRRTLRKMEWRSSHMVKLTHSRHLSFSRSSYQFVLAQTSPSLEALPFKVGHFLQDGILVIWLGWVQNNCMAAVVACSPCILLPAAPFIPCIDSNQNPIYKTSTDDHCLESCWARWSRFTGIRTGGIPTRPKAYSRDCLHEGFKNRIGCLSGFPK